MVISLNLGGVKELFSVEFSIKDQVFRYWLSVLNCEGSNPALLVEADE